MLKAHERIRQFLLGQTGVLLGVDKDYLIESRLQDLQRKWQLKGLPELAQRLEHAVEPALAEDVISALTTHETSWFRDARLFDALRTDLLPRWRQRSRRKLALWSAACSTGQEAYSMAMLLQEEGLRPPDWDIRFLASDVCRHSLAQAQAGLYSPFEVERGLSAQRQHRHGAARGAQWEVAAELRDMVRFEHRNLIRLPADAELFDIVFCRNVLVYFAPEVRLKVLGDLSARLREGGHLFLGAAEYPLGLEARLAPVPGHSGVYRRL